MQFNDFYSPTGNLQTGWPQTNVIGFNGNISIDPWLVCPPNGDYHLLTGSPCIDNGTNGLPVILPDDFEGNPRILTGHSNNAPVVDMGAYEFNPRNAPTPCMFIDCQTDLVIYTAAGQSSVAINFPAPAATPSATLTSAPPSGSMFLGGTNLVTWTATYGTNSVSCSFNIVVIVAPSITRQPQSVNIPAGQPFTLSVGVAGTPPMSYQWLFQGNAIRGEIGPTLTITNTQAANDGIYSVLVDNAAGSITSSLIRVRVLPAKPSIVSNPSSLNVPAGTNAVFNVVASLSLVR